MLHVSPPHSQSQLITVTSVKSRESDFPFRVHVIEEDIICWFMRFLMMVGNGGERTECKFSPELVRRKTESVGVKLRMFIRRSV